MDDYLENEAIELLDRAVALREAGSPDAPEVMRAALEAANAMCQAIEANRRAGGDRNARLIDIADRGWDGSPPPETKLARRIREVMRSEH